MNTYSVQLYPEGFTATGGLPAPITVTAAQFTTTEDYAVFLDSENPQQAVLLVPFSLNPVIMRTAVGS